MSVGVVSSHSQPQVHERLQRLLWSLRELEQRHLSQRVLVRSVLDLNPVLVRLKNPDPDCGRRHEEELTERPETQSGRSLDAELKSELQDLDRQILELRLDAAWSHAPPLTPESPAPDSRPSSGFFSDGASHSNSAFSLCSAFDTVATPTSPVTPPPVSGVPRPAPLQRSVSAPSSAPPLSLPPPAHLDRFISSLLRRRTSSKTFRPVLIQTSLSHRTGATGRLTPPPGAPPTLATGRLTPPPRAPPTLATRGLTPPPGAPPTLTAEGADVSKGRKAAAILRFQTSLSHRAGATGRLTPPPGAPPMLATGRLTPPTAGRLTPPTLTAERAAEGAALSKGRKVAAILRFQTEERQFSCGESEEQRRRRSHRRRSRRKHLTHGVREGSPKTKRGGGERRRRLGQSRSSRAMMSPEHSEGGRTEEETGSEGERTGRGGTKRLQLVRIKASRNLKKRILRQKTATFTLMTTM